MHFQSKEDFLKAANGPRKRTILADGNYIMKIVSVELNRLCQSYDSYKSRGRADVSTLPKEETELKVGLKFLVYSDKDDEIIKDVEGNPVGAMTHFMYSDLRPNFLFNLKTKKPTPLRSLIAFASGNNPNTEFEFPGELTDLIGKYVGVQVVLTDTSSKIEDFTKLPSGFIPDEALEAKGQETLDRYNEARMKRMEPAMVGGIDTTDVPF